MSGTRYPLQITPKVPPPLERMEELANNLWYSWDRQTRALFVQLAKKLWRASGHSPKGILKRVDQKTLDEAAEDQAFLSALARVMSAYDAYHNIQTQSNMKYMEEGDLIAYFCAEFGFHESLPIYSGGLGILAGDHCKTASDLNLPFVGMGLLYRQGYFYQTIDAQGVQHAEYHDANIDYLPIKPVFRDDQTELVVEVPYPGRVVRAKVWTTRIGHVYLYLLDSNLPENNAHDRDITHRLYGGDRRARIEQEILLGMGGVQALEALGLNPTVWHINEGHAAFLILERIRKLVADGQDFDTAHEAVAASTVFTTHTVVPAGHDHFSTEIMREYFEVLCPTFGCDIAKLLELGAEPGESDFNMTALAVRGSRHQNGVSRIHGKVSAEMCTYLWPQIDAEENPLRYVTNGVHLPTFFSDLWHDALSRVCPDWRLRITDPQCWEAIYDIPDQQFWGIRQTIKSTMLHLLRTSLGKQYARAHVSHAWLERALRYMDPDNPNVLTIGFARRFATYKRATLLFSDLESLRNIVCDEKCPVVFIFAGKAHPADAPGQAIVRRIAEVAAMPEFLGHIILLEGYDLHLARRLVSGVDVWLNNPSYPLEASGTSGMKAAVNGVPNLSVLDGWWGEACDDTPGLENGWGITPVNSEGKIDDPDRDIEEAQTLYDILKDKLIPLYYEREPAGHPPGWVSVAKRSIVSIAPRFNSKRMLEEYVEDFYQPAARQWRRFADHDFTGARELAQWKAKVRQSWPDVEIERTGKTPERFDFGEAVNVTVAVRLKKLSHKDVKVEMLFGRPKTPNNTKPSVLQSLPFEFHETRGDGASLFRLELKSELCGLLEYRIRVYPTHELLTHPFEMGMMLWL